MSRRLQIPNEEFQKLGIAEGQKVIVQVIENSTDGKTYVGIVDFLTDKYIGQILVKDEFFVKAEGEDKTEVETGKVDTEPNTA